jgi:hypothetical protein
MSIPSNRQEFKKWCLRKLGHPVIKINVTDEQLDDRVDEALRKYIDFHFEATEKVYFKHQITDQDITNQYITIPANIIGITNIFPVGSSFSTNNLFNIRYQIILNDLFTLNNIDVVPYYMAMQHLSVIEEIFIGKQPLRFNRYLNKLNIDMDWTLAKKDDWFVIEAYQVIDPETYSAVWSDQWLQRYCTALIKENWGELLSKYPSQPMPGGMSLNGIQIKQEAKQEKAMLEDELVHTYSLPILDMIG